jgi:hypothetical protein
MANSDYELRGSVFGFCPYAYLLNDITALQNEIVMSGYSASFPNGIQLNRAVMIGTGSAAEIVVLEDFIGNTLTLGRGCCDTVPRAHPRGTTVWFFDDSIARDPVEHVATDAIGIKVLSRTLSGGAVPIPNSPALPLVFSSRFARPYPPGNVLIDGVNIEGTHRLGDGTDPLVLTWAHRDRIQQADALIKHEVASVGPEAGTTYTVEVLDALGTVVRTETGITGTSWEYLSADARVDLDEPTDDVAGFIRLKAVRDGLDSWQQYVIPFLVTPVATSDLALEWDVE